MDRRAFLSVLVLAPIACTRLPENLEPVEARLVDALPSGFGLLSLPVNLKVALLNPNNTALPVQGLRLSLDLAGTPFARAASDANFSLQPLGETLVNVPARVGTGDLLTRLRQIAGNETPYALEGTLFLRGGRELEVSGVATINLPAPADLPFGGPPPLRLLMPSS